MTWERLILLLVLVNLLILTAYLLVRNDPKKDFQRWAAHSREEIQPANAQFGKTHFLLRHPMEFCPDLEIGKIDNLWHDAHDFWVVLQLEYLSRIARY